MGKNRKEETTETLIIGKILSPEMEELLDEKLYTLGKKKELKIVELSKKEMSQALNLRKNLLEAAEVADFLNDKEQKERAAKLLEKFVKVGRTYFKDEDAFPTLPPLKEKWLKDGTNFSWKQFRNAIDTLELFNLVRKDEDNYIHIIEDDENKQILSISKIKEKLTETACEITQNLTTIKNAKVKRKLKALEKRLLEIDLDVS